MLGRVPISHRHSPTTPGLARPMGVTSLLVSALELMRDFIIDMNYFQCLEINKASCDFAKKISKKKGTIVAGGIVQSGVYENIKGNPESKAEVQKELSQGLEVLIKNDIDLILVEVYTIVFYSYCLLCL